MQKDTFPLLTPQRLALVRGGDVAPHSAFPALTSPPTRHRLETTRTDNLPRSYRSHGSSNEGWEMTMQVVAALHSPPTMQGGWATSHGSRCEAAEAGLAALIEQVRGAEGLHAMASRLYVPIVGLVSIP